LSTSTRFYKTTVLQTKNNKKKKKNANNIKNKKNQKPKKLKRIKCQSIHPASYISKQNIDYMHEKKGQLYLRPNPLA
jgi:hypothetical protein